MSEDTQRIYHPGERLLREGEYGDEAFVILSGRVSICRELDGRLLSVVDVGPGQVIGEMALVDEKPRSATAIALEETRVEVISRRRFRRLLRDDTDLAMDLLQVLFERLREAQSTMFRWQLGSAVELHLPETGDEASGPTSPVTSIDAPTEARDCPTPTTPVLLMTGVSEDACDVLPEEGLRISSYPYRIGRRTRDPLVDNDYAIDDYEPYQISRSHLVFMLDGKRVAIMDRGSYLGLEINGRRLGGDDGEDGAVFLEADNQLWLGGQDSSYEFRVQVIPPVD